ncbi:hypothetical protein OG802_10485 [Streptomyces sp. NBC_00704]|uniref:hypothetical protein n=1 Tax=Streptomyces sp. NBC_00704 TaxID=2975809 RepID=UPI002E375247|nr:hypothetical protein [Streptomyces sp. NBC_00704]
MNKERDVGRRRQRPLRWLLFSTLSCAATLLTWLRGALAGGLDVGETCALYKGQPFDSDYRAGHLRESTQWFPLHNMCNASYDLVPAWINPTVAFLTLATAAGLLMTAWVTGARLRAHLLDRRGTSTDGTGAGTGAARV